MLFFNRKTRPFYKGDLILQKKQTNKTTTKKQQTEVLCEKPGKIPTLIHFP